MPNGNVEILFAAVYKSPSRTWSDININKLLRFKKKFILAGVLNAKYPFWNNAFRNPTGKKTSGPQHPFHYSLEDKGDKLNTVVHQNIRFSHVSVSDILKS
jgi:hypothetical protein